MPQQIHLHHLHTTCTPHAASTCSSCPSPFPRHHFLCHHCTRGSTILHALPPGCTDLKGANRASLTWLELFYCLPRVATSYDSKICCYLFQNKGACIYNSIFAYLPWRMRPPVRRLLAPLATKLGEHRPGTPHTHVATRSSRAVNSSVCLIFPRSRALTDVT